MIQLELIGIRNKKEDLIPYRFVCDFPSRFFKETDGSITYSGGGNFQHILAQHILIHEMIEVPGTEDKTPIGGLVN